MRKLRRKKRYLLAVHCVCAGAAVYAFFLPWVSIQPSAAPLPFSRPAQSWNGWIQNRLAVFSLNKIIDVSLKNKRRILYAGYRVPPAVWRLENGRVTGKFLWLSGKKNVRFQATMLYLYPIFMVLTAFLLYRWRCVWWMRAMAGMGCCAVGAVQIGVVGMYDAASFPVTVYLDYGYWLGAISYCAAGIHISINKK